MVCHLSDELHNLRQVLLLLQNLLDLGPERHELGEVSVVVIVEGLHVLAVGAEPVHGGEVFALGELLVQTPEHLDNAQGGRGHGVGEVSTWEEFTFINIYLV